MLSIPAIIDKIAQILLSSNGNNKKDTADVVREVVNLLTSSGSTVKVLVSFDYRFSVINILFSQVSPMWQMISFERKI